MSKDAFDGAVDTIIYRAFELGFGAHQHYPDRTAHSVEPYYEDNLDSWLQNISNEADDLVDETRQDELTRMPHEAGCASFQLAKYNRKNQTATLGECNCYKAKRAAELNKEAL